MKRPPSYSRGLSLLEILVAFSMLAIVLGALLRVFGTGLHNTDVADRYSLAVLYAESVLASTATEAKLERGEASGKLKNGYSWRRIVQPYVTKDAQGFDPALPVLAYRITAQVYWRARGKTQSVTLNSLRLVPKTLNPASP